MKPDHLSSSPRFAELAARHHPVARRILLAEDDGAAPGLVRFLSTQISLADGARTSWVTVTRTGTFTDPRYGEFSITPAMLAQMVANFDGRVLGQDVFIDVAHKPSDGAAAKVLRLAVDNGRLRALVEWTDFGIDAVQKRGFSYLSAEYHENWRDNEQGNPRGATLLGAGLTTRPVIKHLDRVELSELDDDDESAHKLAVHPTLIKTLTLESSVNKHLKNLRDRLIALGLTEDQIKLILDEALKQLDAAAADDAKCLALVDTWFAAGEAVHKQIKQLSASGQQPAVVTLQMGQAPNVAAEVARLLAERETAAANDAATLAAKVKLLSDTVNAATALGEDTRAAMVAELTPMVTKQLSDDQVKALAQLQISNYSRLSAAQQLVTLGYRPASGSVRIEVVGSGEVKSLQAEVDKRLGFQGMSEARRYQRTGGRLLEANKDFAEKCLAQFDAMYGAQLVAEHKMLAGGAGVSSDVAVPAIFERTVLREALYQIVGLNFVNTGNIAFAAVAQIPYSYRDTSAAGANSTRVYEGQAIPRGGVIQTFEEARPIPQKIAFQVSNEMRYLAAGAQIDWDPLAENVQNCVRIVSEDTDKLIQNELLNATDEALVATTTDTLTSQVNGTNKIFVLAQWPVVRPRKVFDLKGVQVGSTVNPITVTLGGTARAEYQAGVALAAGTYYVLDHNMGEIRFVNELGALQTPANATALTVAYSYTQNVTKVNIDVGAAPDTIGLVYDRVLNQIGGRKAVIESDRFYMADLLLMSGTVDNALGQATTFTANASRPGTGLNADGSVGIVKGMSAFNTRAPGLNTGDTRLIVGERGNTRFRMMRPFSMNDLMEEKDSNGYFVGKKGNYGEQWVVCMTPTQRKNATTSLVLYSAAGRVARAA